MNITERCTHTTLQENVNIFLGAKMAIILDNYLENENMSWSFVLLFFKMAKKSNEIETKVWIIRNRETDNSKRSVRQTETFGSFYVFIKNKDYYKIKKKVN